MLIPKASQGQLDTALDDFLRKAERGLFRERIQAMQTAGLIPTKEEVKSALEEGLGYRVALSFDTKLKFEEAFNLVWASLNDAKTSALEWSSLASSIDSIVFQTQTIDGDIQAIWEKYCHELSANDEYLLNAVEQASLRFEAVVAARNSYQKTLDTTFGEVNNKWAPIATRTTSAASFVRDPLPGAPLPFSKTVVADYGFFDAGTTVELSAIAASVWQSDVQRAYSRGQTEQSLADATAAVTAALGNVQGLRSQIAILDSQKDQLLMRLRQLRLQNRFLQSKLSGSPDALKNRLQGIIVKYSAARYKLEVFASAFVTAINNVEPELLPREIQQRIESNAKFDLTLNNVNLDQLSAAVNLMDAIFRSRQLSIGSLIFRQRAKVKRGVSTPLMVLGELPNCYLRGLSARCLSGDAPILLSMHPPQVGKQTSREKKSREVEQKEASSIFVTAFLDSVSANLPQGERPCWNLSPYGEWHVSIGDDQDLEEVDLEISFYADYFH